MYINAHSLGNKQEKLELHMQWHNCDSVGLPEISWDSLHNWNAVVDRWMQAAQERQAGQDEGRGLSSMWGSSLGVWSLMGQTTGWLRSCGSGSEERLVRATSWWVCYRSRNPGEEVDKVFKQLKKFLHHRPCVMLILDICWKSNVMGYK